jgi:hypothetical protein
MFATISGLARAQGVDKALISRRVKALEASGQLKCLPLGSNKKFVDLAAYCLATGIPLDKLEASRTQTAEGSDRHVSAARCFADLVQNAARDTKAGELLAKIDSDLGYLDRELLRRVLVRNYTLAQISKLDAKSVAFLAQRLRLALDLVAATLGFH